MNTKYEAIARILEIETAEDMLEVIHLVENLKMCMTVLGDHIPLNLVELETIMTTEEPSKSLVKVTKMYRDRTQVHLHTCKDVVETYIEYFC